MPETPLALVVDDQISHLRLTELLLVNLGFRVLTAEHPRDALEHLKAHTPDLVVLDVLLPDMSGIDIAGRLKHVARLRDTSVLFMTSERTRAVVEQAAWEGVRTVLQKPVSTRALEAAVRAAVPSLPTPAEDPPPAGLEAPRPDAPSAPPSSDVRAAAAVDPVAPSVASP